MFALAIIRFRRLKTVLNVGINDLVVHHLSALYGRRFALDTYRTFLQLFGVHVRLLKSKVFRTIILQLKSREGVTTLTEISEDGLETLVQEFKKLVSAPNDPYEQLFLTIEAVYKNLNSPRYVSVIQKDV
jgi:pyruvate, orthophosphate dikinase